MIQFRSALLFLLALGACTQTNTGQQPAWMAERSEEDPRGYPNLREVPRTTIANTNTEHWAQTQQELADAAAALRANPRGQYVPPEDPAIFVEQARSDLEAARQSHEPDAQ